MSREHADETVNRHSPFFSMKAKLAISAFTPSKVSSSRMASLLQPPAWLSSSRSGNSITPLFSPSKATVNLVHHPFKASVSASPSEPEPEESAPGPVDPVKLAFEKAKAYRKSKEPKPEPEAKQNLSSRIDGGNGSSGGGSNGGVSDSVRISMENAKEYRKNKGVNSDSGVVKDTKSYSGSKFKEEKGDNKGQLVISSIDFVGLGFADKKMTRGLPAGLLPVIDTFPVDDIADVEIIVGDSSKFGKTSSNPAPTQQDNTDLYKPKVSTWGVFPRPGNISKTYGGGKVIRPGDQLETAEDRAAKDAKTRELIAAYNKQIGLNIDPKLKSECEEVLKEGDSLMDSGMLKEALPCYEEVMKKLPFKSELHGLAALQWAICQDSLTRRSQAQSMYEKLQSHPNPKVSKKARQFVFSFQAMDMMKVSSSMLSTKSIGYEDYFDAFIEDKTKSASQEDEEGAFTNAFPYIAFLLSPILLVLFIAIQKGT